MDRRRALLSGGGFPENYLFKEGLGFREDLVYETYSTDGAGATITNNSIYMHGGKSCREVIMVNYGTTINSSDIITSVNNLDLSKYTKLCIEATDEGNASRSCCVGIYKEGQFKPTLEKISGSTNYFDPIVVFYGSSTRRVVTVDISSKNSGTFLMRSPDFNLALTVYNIWFE